ncbi:short chain dehydrogenase [Solitalea sp. MAHUQ-68]|uniref:Short chain dehydrogenase n=1 Tax=Solitalea agri TaxID=2953739 RepID=A0A9X2F541_9SPHI|nr:short chain dehydrogenase [Solitalea agri]MCO4294375.1 short chain dehydrogenase [Solitalea agri]
MKIIIVGATGTIGKVVSAELKKRHEIVSVGSKSGDVQVDINSKASIEKLFETVGNFDALVSTTGSAFFGPFSELTEERMYEGIRSKLMVQVNLVLEGRKYIKPNGSFTLTSGILAEDPIKMGAALSMVNGAINSFVIGASVELENQVRINAVSPGVVEDSRDLYGPYFPGHIPVSMERVVAAYIKSIEGAINGQVIKVY